MECYFPDTGTAPRRRFVPLLVRPAGGLGLARAAPPARRLGRAPAPVRLRGGTRARRLGAATAAALGAAAARFHRADLGIRRSHCGLS